MQPARHECHACCSLQAEKPGIQPVVGNTHDTHVVQVVSSFQKILRGSQELMKEIYVKYEALTCPNNKVHICDMYFPFYMGSDNILNFQIFILRFEFFDEIV